MSPKRKYEPSSFLIVLFDSTLTNKATYCRPTAGEEVVIRPHINEVLCEAEATVPSYKFAFEWMTNSCSFDTVLALFLGGWYHHFNEEQQLLLAGRFPKCLKVALENSNSKNKESLFTTMTSKWNLYDKVRIITFLHSTLAAYTYNSISIFSYCRSLVLKRLIIAKELFTA